MRTSQLTSGATVFIKYERSFASQEEFLLDSLVAMTRHAHSPLICLLGSDSNRSTIQKRRNYEQLVDLPICLPRVSCGLLLLSFLTSQLQHKPTKLTWCFVCRFRILSCTAVFLSSFSWFQCNDSLTKTTQKQINLYLESWELRTSTVFSHMSHDLSVTLDVACYVSSPFNGFFKP